MNFRGSLIRKLAANGVTVFALAPDFNDDLRAAVRALGAEPVDYVCQRAALNPLRDVIDTIRLAYLLRRLQPDATLCYFIKPVIFGTLAAWAAGVAHRVALIEGLGFIFTNEFRLSARRRILRKLVVLLYRIALKRAHRVIVLNNDDLAELSEWGALERSKASLVPGIGVDLDYFSPVPNKSARPAFVLVARMLRSKGVADFVEAARLVREKYPDTRFVLVGGTDANPNSISEKELSLWDDEGAVEWLGQIKDVRASLADASALVLPSYYREGLPRSIQEAMAMAKPIVTTDVPGCRDTVVEGLNGFIVPPRDPKALAAAMTRLIERPELVDTMGSASRQLAELRYDERKINDQMLRELQVG